VARLTVRAALRQSRHDTGTVAAGPRPAGRPRGVITAWFNPWAHQSGEQVWAGLAHEVIEAAGALLYPTEAERERYWFARNLRLVDRHTLRRTLHRRILSPLLGVALAAVAAPLAFALAELNAPIRLFGHSITAAAVALGIPVAFLLAGAVHTAVRYRWGRAAQYLPAELFWRPVNDGVPGTGGENRGEMVTDPLRRARAGALYLHQHNIADLLTDIAEHNHELVVFVDDLDRCRAATVVEVFEAINLFLSGVTARAGMVARFVVGLDPAVVAAHLDSEYLHGTRGEHHGSGIALHGDDPSPGWAFLRKLVQLPVAVPRIPDDAVHRFVDGLGAPSTVDTSRDRTAHRPAPAPALEPASPAGRRQPTDGQPAGGSPSPVEVRAWKSMEQHPAVHDLLSQRLLAQPERSVREAKRLVNVWQLYERVLGAIEPLTEPTEAIQRARRLVLVAEILTRWPALQRNLHQTIDGRRGLQLLAASTADDQAWHDTARTLDIDQDRHARALANLRRLLHDHDGPAIADLADRVL
jgi:hypothetical protein